MIYFLRLFTNLPFACCSSAQLLLRRHIRGTWAASDSVGLCYCLFKTSWKLHTDSSPDPVSPARRLPGGGSGIWGASAKISIDLWNQFNHPLIVCSTFTCLFQRLFVCLCCCCFFLSRHLVVWFRQSFSWGTGEDFECERRAKTPPRPCSQFG